MPGTSHRGIRVRPGVDENADDLRTAGKVPGQSVTPCSNERVPPLASLIRARPARRGLAYFDIAWDMLLRTSSSHPAASGATPPKTPSPRKSPSPQPRPTTAPESGPGNLEPDLKDNRHTYGR